MSEEKSNIAVLIDAENVDPSFADQIFAYARSLGTVTVREIYGAGIALNEWADPILENTIHTNFTLRPNRFKNSSDIALVIGAMELLRLSAAAPKESDKIAAMVIASSDCDFSPLAVYLRAAGIDIIGMGEPGRINPMWPKACTEFVALDAHRPLVRRREDSTPPETHEPAPVKAPQPEQPAPEKPAAPAEAKPAKAKAEAAPHKEKAEKPQFAPNHPARVAVIRAFIEKQIEENEGRVQSGKLFKQLAALPDYKYDQKRSKRTPQDYLTRQFSDWFTFEPGERGSCWISLRADAAPAPEAEPEAQQADFLTEAPEAEAPETRQAESLPVTEEAAPETLAPETEASLEAPETEGSEGLETPDNTPEEAPQAEEEAVAAPAEGNSEQIAALLAAGIPEENAPRIADILAACRNLRDVYNRMRKEFGTGQGKQFYELIKKAFA